MFHIVFEEKSQFPSAVYTDKNFSSEDTITIGNVFTTGSFYFPQLGF